MQEDEPSTGHLKMVFRPRLLEQPEVKLGVFMPRQKSIERSPRKPSDR